MKIRSTHNPCPSAKKSDKRDGLVGLFSKRHIGKQGSKKLKRIGHLFEQICTDDVIVAAIQNAAKGKKYRVHVSKVLNNMDYYVQDLKKKLLSGTLELSHNTVMQYYDLSCRKERTITVPKFYPDQVVHWLITTALMPVLTREMYKYCCGSVPDRGGMMAKRYVESVIKDEKMRYVAKLDISKFFYHIDPNIMLQMFKRRVKDKRFLEIVAKVLKNGGDSLPIGYYTSQWFSNFYLQEFDHFIKEKLKIKYYVRYVDDMVMIDSNKRKLRKAVAAINEYLHNINLELKGNWQVWKIDSRPIDFVGYRFYQGKTLLRKKIYFKICRRLRNVKKKRYITPHQAMGLLSLLGWLKHIRAGKWYKKFFYPFARKKKLTRIVSNYAKQQKIKLGGI